jgi:hypothetical protein
MNTVTRDGTAVGTRWKGHHFERFLGHHADSTQAQLGPSEAEQTTPRPAEVGNPDRGIEMDVLTMIAVSTVAWALADVLHEIVGHGGAAVLLGIPVRAVSTTTIFADWDQIQSMAEVRAIHASATVLNLVTAGLALLALRSPRVTRPATRYFLWVFATISLLIVTLNLTVGATSGDWSVVIEGMEPAGLWRAGVLAAGILVAIVNHVLPLKLWLPDLRGRRWLQLKITAIPVLVLLVVQTLSVLGSPFTAVPRDSGTNALVSSWALTLFFGVWLALVNLIPVPRSTAPMDSIRLPRSNGWLAVGLVVAVFFIGVLGPGLGPLEADPRLTLVR